MVVNDLDKLVEIEKRSNPYPLSRDKILNYIESGQPCQVCCLSHQGATIIAYAIAMTVLDEYSLLNICVDQVHQGKGNGKAFLKHLIEQAIENHQKSFFLEVRYSNTRAIALYKSLGFTLDGTRKNYYPGGSNEQSAREDALTFSLSL